MEYIIRVYNRVALAITAHLADGSRLTLRKFKINPADYFTSYAGYSVNK
jgi:hypothetical protein